MLLSFRNWAISGNFAESTKHFLKYLITCVFSVTHTEYSWLLLVSSQICFLYRSLGTWECICCPLHVFVCLGEWSGAELGPCVCRANVQPRSSFPALPLLSERGSQRVAQAGLELSQKDLELFILLPQPYSLMSGWFQCCHDVIQLPRILCLIFFHTNTSH